MELKRFINFSEYQNIKALEMANRYYLPKHRSTFLYKGVFFTLDTLTIKDVVFSILIVQGTKEGANIEIPSLILQNVVEEAAADVPTELLTELLVKSDEFASKHKEKLSKFNDSTD